MKEAKTRVQARRKKTNQNIPPIYKDGRTTNHETDTYLRKMLTDVKDSLGTLRNKEMFLKVLMGWGWEHKL